MALQQHPCIHLLLKYFFHDIKAISQEIKQTTTFTLLGVFQIYYNCSLINK